VPVGTVCRMAAVHRAASDMIVETFFSRNFCVPYAVRGARFLYLGRKVNMTGRIYTLNRGLRTDLGTRDVRAYLANLRMAAFQASPGRRRAESAGRMGIVLPAVLTRFCDGAGVGSGAWVPA